MKVDLPSQYVLLFHCRLESSNDTAYKDFEAFLKGHRQLCNRHYIDIVISWIVPIIFAAIVVVGVLGNSLVLFVVTFWQQMRNSTNVLILVITV